VSERVRVVVVDDHPIFRQGFAALLASMEEMAVVGTAGDGRQALELVDTLGSDEIDVVVMDVQMPVLDGVEATRRLAESHPDLRVIVLTMSEQDTTVLDAIQAGARGYLLKGAEPDEIRRAIATVASGGLVFGGDLAERVAGIFATASAASASQPFPQLSAREQEVLDLIAAGLSNQQIAARLFLSPKTVRNHVSAVITKLRATDRSEAIIRGRDAGLGRISGR
jgi:DNA-binding NarL/FixJ family response regulator